MYFINNLTTKNRKNYDELSEAMKEFSKCIKKHNEAEFWSEFKILMYYNGTTLEL